MEGLERLGTDGAATRPALSVPAPAQLRGNTVVAVWVVRYAINKVTVL